MNDKQGISPTLPITGQGNPEPTVPAGQPRPLLFSLIDGELSAKGKILEHECLMTTREEENQAKKT
jgi:hypothetical protein